jgi:predicted transcriptional regulator
LDTTQLTNVFKRLLEFASQKYDVDDYEISRFTKLVKRQASKPETCLKVILSPTEAIVETYKSLVKSPSIAEIQQLMEMKGLSKAEQSQLVKKMQQTGGTSKGKNH